jgi:hypothetical protein
VVLRRASKAQCDAWCDAGCDAWCDVSGVVLRRASKAQFIVELEEFRRKVLGSGFEEKPYSMETVTVENIIEVKEEPYHMS